MSSLVTTQFLHSETNEEILTCDLVPAQYMRDSWITIDGQNYIITDVSMLVKKISVSGYKLYYYVRVSG